MLLKQSIKSRLFNSGQTAVVHRGNQLHSRTYRSLPPKIYPLPYAVKNEQKIFLISKEIQKGSVAVIYEEELPNIMYEEMRKYLAINEEAVSYI
jgi:hypothetical protein